MDLLLSSGGKREQVRGKGDHRRAEKLF